MNIRRIVAVVAAAGALLTLLVLAACGPNTDNWCYDGMEFDLRHGDLEELHRYIDRETGEEYLLPVWRSKLRRNVPDCTGADLRIAREAQAGQPDGGNGATGLFLIIGGVVLGYLLIVLLLLLASKDGRRLREERGLNTWWDRLSLTKQRVLIVLSPLVGGAVGIGVVILLL